MLGQPQISIHAMNGIPSYSTMKIVGSFGTRRLYILVDSGSTHNFISEKLAKLLQCVTYDVPALKVSVANGNQINCAKMCKKFQWMMQGMWFEADVMVIPLDSYDMVLGIQWLSPLGDIVWNFNQLTMEFMVNGEKKVLKGISNNNKISLCSIEQMEHMLSHSNQLVESHMYGIQLVSLEGQNGQSTNVSREVRDDRLEELLNQYPMVFEEPKGLPPSRECDHKIELKK
ncbi:putative aspartic peptidase domain superfamily [Helianthus annuus]|nr:putative aspartic peptidase domain superfamily [Helianthus annuus]